VYVTDISVVGEDGAKVDGFQNTNKVYFRYDSETATMQEELGHLIKTQDENSYNVLKDTIFESVDKTDFAQRIFNTIQNAMIESYSEIYDSMDIITEEVIMHISSEIYSGKNIEVYKSLFGNNYDNVVNEVNKYYNSKYDGSVNSGQTRFSLKPVTPIEPTNTDWRRTLNTDEAKKMFPSLWDVSQDESIVRNPTQIKGTVTTYKKIYNILKEENFNGTILDASSGLGYGTKVGIEEYNFNVDDIEPYPDKSYQPKYKDYSRLNKKYDVIISNAVLNVLPQDQRDALVVKMGSLLKDNGRIFINVRGDDVNSLGLNKDNVNISPMEWFVSSTGSYQKGFTKSELKAYLQDALGDDFTVETTNKFGKTSAIVTKIDFNNIDYVNNKLYNVKKVDFNTFPSYKTSQSDAHEIATRWAYREDVNNGNSRIVFYKGKPYIIEKFESLDFKYQVYGTISNYDKFIRFVKENKTYDEQRRFSKRSDKNLDKNRKMGFAPRRRGSVDNSSDIVRENIGTIQKMDSIKNGEQRIKNHVNRNIERNIKNRENPQNLKNVPKFSTNVDIGGKIGNVNKYDDDLLQSISQSQMENILNRAFNVFDIKNYYDGKIKNIKEWIEEVGADVVALHIESDYAIYNVLKSYLTNEEFFDNYSVEDLVNAYYDCKLGDSKKSNTRNIDLSKNNDIKETKFYYPQKIENAKELFDIANQRVTNSNRKEVNEARAKLLLFAHTDEGLEQLGLTKQELNKKLRSWSGYTANAIAMSNKLNKNVAESNRWSGIENTSWINKSTITTDDIRNVVKSVDGEFSEYQAKYISDALLSLDTHINWKWLSIKISSSDIAEYNKSKNSSSCRGYYSKNDSQIVVDGSSKHTVSHEIGHALDSLWGAEISNSDSPEYLTEIFRSSVDKNYLEWYDNFKNFQAKLSERSDISSGYAGNQKETFARFISRFCEWTQNISGNTNWTDSHIYNDKFSVTDYYDFVKILQEKSYLDGKYNTEYKPKVQKNLDLSATLLYNENESEQYGVMWTLESGALNKKEIAQFYTKVAETKKQNYKDYVVSNDGEYIFSVGNKLIYTDSDYDYPEISKVITFNTNDNRIIDHGKEMLYYAEQQGYKIEEFIGIIKDVYGKEIIQTTTYRNFVSNRQSENSRGKGRNGKENYSDSRENEVKQRGIAPTKETKFSIKNEKLEKEMEKLGKNVPKKDLKGETVEDRWVAERTDGNKVTILVPMICFPILEICIHPMKNTIDEKGGKGTADFTSIAIKSYLENKRK